MVGIQPNGVLLKRILSRESLFGVVAKSRKSLGQCLSVPPIRHAKYGVLSEFAIHYSIFGLKVLYLAVYCLIM